MTLQHLAMMPQKMLNISRYPLMKVWEEVKLCRIKGFLPVWVRQANYVLETTLGENNPGMSLKGACGCAFGLARVKQK